MTGMTRLTGALFACVQGSLLYDCTADPCISHLSQNQCIVQSAAADQMPTDSFPIYQLTGTDTSTSWTSRLCDIIQSYGRPRGRRKKLERSIFPCEPETSKHMCVEDFSTQVGTAARKHILGSKIIVISCKDAEKPALALIGVVRRQI